MLKEPLDPGGSGDSGGASDRGCGGGGGGGCCLVVRGLWGPDRGMYSADLPQNQGGFFSLGSDHFRRAGALSNPLGAELGGGRGRGGRGNADLDGYPTRAPSRFPGVIMASDENMFFGLKVPEGNDRRELYKSQYRAIYTYKMSAQELDQAFRDAVTSDGPDGGWSIKNDERVKYVGKLEVAKGEDTTLKVCLRSPL